MALERREYVYFCPAPRHIQHTWLTEKGLEKYAKKKSSNGPAANKIYASLPFDVPVC
jgi:hypothetical protein